MAIYRFKFSSQISDELDSFVSINKFCVPEDFRDNWDKWTETNKELIDNEIIRLKKLGYVGNVIDKMYRSARYYLKNKSDIKELSKRKKYIRLSKTFREYMDCHVDRIINNMKPSDGLDLFINMGIVKKMIKDEMVAKKINKEEITNRVKKMYKNRYYIKQKKKSD